MGTGAYDTFWEKLEKKHAEETAKNTEQLIMYLNRKILRRKCETPYTQTQESTKAYVRYHTCALGYMRVDEIHTRTGYRAHKRLIRTVTGDDTRW